MCCWWESEFEFVLYCILKGGWEYFFYCFVEFGLYDVVL